MKASRQVAFAAVLALSAWLLAAAGAGAQMVYLDKDGHPIVPSPPQAASVPSRKAAGAAAPAPLPQEQRAPGGGVMVILDSRFDRSVVGHLDARRQLHLDCQRGDGPAASPGQR